MIAYISRCVTVTDVVVTVSVTAIAVMAAALLAVVRAAASNAGHDNVRVRAAAEMRRGHDMIVLWDEEVVMGAAVNQKYLLMLQIRPANKKPEID